MGLSTHVQHVKRSGPLKLFSSYSPSYVVVANYLCPYAVPGTPPCGEYQITSTVSQEHFELQEQPPAHWQCLPDQNRLQMQRAYSLSRHQVSHENMDDLADGVLHTSRAAQR